MSAAPPPPRSPYPAYGAPTPPPPPAPNRTGLVIAVLAGVVVAAAGIWFSGWGRAVTASPPSVIAGPSGGQAPSFSRPASSAAPAASMSKKTDAIPAVYGASLGSACKAMGAATDWASTQALFSAQTTCLNAQWSAVFAKAGRTFTPPQLKFVTTSPDTKCTGDPPDPKVYPAYYCRLDTYTIYLFDSITPTVVADRAVAFMTLSHEYMHHVQWLLGIGEGATGDKDELTRRSELQAQCVAMHQLSRTTGLGTSQADLDLIKKDWNRDTPHHGSAASRVFWNQTGLTAATIGACDTYAAPAAKVT